jgi:hypothetical protein
MSQDLDLEQRNALRRETSKLEIKICLQCPVGCCSSHSFRKFTGFVPDISLKEIRYYGFSQHNGPNLR